MLQLKSLLKVSDNTGISLVEFIRVITSKKKVKVGDVLLVILKNFYKQVKGRQSKKIKRGLKGQLSKAIVIHIKKIFMRIDGSYSKFFNNSIILLNKNLMPLGTRLLGCVSYDFLDFKTNRRFKSVMNKLF